MAEQISLSVSFGHEHDDLGGTADLIWYSREIHHTILLVISSRRWILFNSDGNTFYGLTSANLGTTRVLFIFSLTLTFGGRDVVKDNFDRRFFQLGECRVEPLIVSKWHIGVL